MSQISTPEDIQKAIEILDRHIDILENWYQQEPCIVNQSVLEESVCLHAGMRYYCVELQKLLRDEKYKQFDRKYLKSAVKIPALLTSVQDQSSWDVTHYPGLKDCADLLIVICNHAISLQHLYNEKRIEMQERDRIIASYAKKVETISVFFCIGLGILSVIILGSGYLATATPFLLYFVIPALLIWTIILALSIEFQKGLYQRSFIRKADEIQTAHPIISQHFIASIFFNSGLNRTMRIAKDILLSIRDMKDSSLNERTLFPFATRRSDADLPIPMFKNTNDYPVHATTFQFFTYPHPKQLSDDVPPPIYTPT